MPVAELIGSSVGILQNTLLPNFIFHTSVSAPAYALARSTNQVQVKDVIWSSAQAANAWYAAVGSRLLMGVPLATALSTITRPGWLILGGVTLWAARLTYRVVSRASRTGWEDDKRYEWVKKEPGGWAEAAVLFAMEGLVQSLVGLPFTAPFRTSYPVVRSPNESKGSLEALAIGLYGAGLGLELLADWQLQSYKDKGGDGVLDEGVWSIVRHPNYLGDILTHLSFPLLLYANDLFHPALLLGPLTNYLFLRHISGDKENEQNQMDRYATTDPAKLGQFNQYREKKNAIWPKFHELTNMWSWAAVAAGVGAVGVVKALDRARVW